MAGKRNQVTVYFSDEEFDQLEFDAQRAGLDKTPFAKHVILNRGKLKVKALPGDAAKEIARLTQINEELQRQLDTLQTEKGRNEVLSGLGSTPPKTIDELVAEKFQRLKDQQDLENYRKLQEDHVKLQERLADRDKTVGRLTTLETWGPVLANGLGSILVQKFPEMAHGVATAANAFGGQLGQLPAPAAPAKEDDELTEIEEKMLDFGRTVLTALPEADAAQLAMLVQTIVAMPPLLPPVVQHAQQLIPQIHAQMQNAPPVPA